jgi:DNA (cytosine-5)-methyltransferase 1
MIKILNLYAGIGGNRKLWEGEIEITAIENNEEIAKIYQSLFPKDKVIITDAHQYLLEHFREFDFIWSSPPCPTHSRVRKQLAFRKGKEGRYEQNKPVFPDMKLYEEILFLDNYFKGKWVVENVISYYEPLIKPIRLGRHYIWANFEIPFINVKGGTHQAKIKDMAKHKGFDISNWKIKHRKDTILRNCVEEELGLHIFKMAFKKEKQIEYF